MVSAGSSFQPAFTGFAFATWPFFTGEGLALIVLRGGCSQVQFFLRLSPQYTSITPPIPNLNRGSPTDRCSPPKGRSQDYTPRTDRLLSTPAACGKSYRPQMLRCFLCGQLFPLGLALTNLILANSPPKKKKVPIFNYGTYQYIYV